ncbi:MAG: hypothetical protein CVV02_15140 [Firmicutes bacterium HGW-Firmicutes-7]|nr:MAG: hypothetical protein CVV02_15140 [Firmicutes bacterium HGW-Firmicutes-7]
MDRLTLNIIVSIIFICTLGLLWYFGQKRMVKNIILGLVIQAEINWGSGAGKLKFIEVMTVIYEKLPLIIRIFVPQRKITEWIESAVKYIKIELTKDGQTVEQFLSNNNT